MYILEELKKVLNGLSGGWKMNSQETVLTFSGIIVYAKNEAFLNEHIKQSKQKWEVNKNNIDEYIKQIKVLKKKGLLPSTSTSKLSLISSFFFLVSYLNDSIAFCIKCFTSTLTISGNISPASSLAATNIFRN